MNLQQWHERRRLGIGSSDAPVLMGVSPYKTVNELWHEKVTGKNHIKDNPSMKRGRDLEELARVKFEKMVGVSVMPCELTHPEFRFLRANLDGLDIDRKIAVEIKWPKRVEHEMAKEKKVPEKYFPQCQHQLNVLGIEQMFYFSCFDDDFQIVDVKKDQEYIDRMQDIEINFWKMVKEMIEPPVTDKDYVNMENSSTWNYRCSQLQHAQSEIKHFESKCKELKESLLQLSEGKRARGDGFKLTSISRKGNVDYEAAIKDYLDNMRSHYPDVHFPEIPLEPYRKDNLVIWKLVKEG